MNPTWQTEDGRVKLWHGDCLDVMKSWPDGAVDAVVTDPPYGVTSLQWDTRVDGWLDYVRAPQLWCFGSMRFWLECGEEFTGRDWSYAQEIIWEKHNGSIFHADRFRRVHEIAVHWYRGQWSTLYSDVPTTRDAVKRAVRRKGRPQHTGEIAESTYTSVDGGPRLMRSVQYVRSCHGTAEHPTQKPVDITSPQVQFSTPNNGVVADPFMGSGTTGVAALRLNRQFWGVEIDEKYFEIAKRRILEELNRHPLFEEQAQVAK